MKPKGLGELCEATSDLASQTGIEKNKQKTNKKKQQKKKTKKQQQQQQQQKKKKKKKKNKQTDLFIIHKPNLTSSHFKQHINGPWKPEARNRTRSSFYACPGYQQV